jgi:hypothetical protein
MNLSENPYFLNFKKIGLETYSLLPFYKGIGTI